VDASVVGTVGVLLVAYACDGSSGGGDGDGGAGGLGVAIRPSAPYLVTGETTIDTDPTRERLLYRWQGWLVAGVGGRSGALARYFEDWSWRGWSASHHAGGVSNSEAGTSFVQAVAGDSEVCVAWREALENGDRMLLRCHQW